MMIGNPAVFAFDITIHEEFTRGDSCLSVNARVFVNGKCVSEEFPSREYWLTEQVWNLEDALDPLRWDRNYTLPAEVMALDGTQILQYIYDKTYVWRDDDDWPDPRISAMVTGCTMTNSSVPLEDLIIVVLPVTAGYRIIASRDLPHGTEDPQEYFKAAVMHWPHEVEEVVVPRHFFHDMYERLTRWVDEEHAKRGLPVGSHARAFQPEIPEA